MGSGQDGGGEKETGLYHSQEAGSKDKDARNREHKATKATKTTKATEKKMQKEAEVSTQTTGATKGGNIPPMLKPKGDQVGRTPRPPRLAIGSNCTPGRREKSEQPPIPATLRPGSQLFQAVPPPAQLGLRPHPVLNILETPATQGTESSDIRNSTASSTAWV